MYNHYHDDRFSAPPSCTGVTPIIWKPLILFLVGLCVGAILMKLDYDLRQDKTEWLRILAEDEQPTTQRKLLTAGTLSSFEEHRLLTAEPSTEGQTTITKAREHGPTAPPLKLEDAKVVENFILPEISDLSLSCEWSIPKDVKKVERKELCPKDRTPSVAIVIRWYQAQDPLALLATLNKAALKANETLLAILIDTDPFPTDDTAYGRISLAKLEMQVQTYAPLFTNVILRILIPDEKFRRCKKNILLGVETYGYVETDFALDHITHTAFPEPWDYLVITNADNIYNDDLLRVTLEARKKGFAAIGFSFSTRYNQTRHGRILKPEHNQMKVDFKRDHIDLGAAMWHRGVIDINHPCFTCFNMEKPARFSPRFYKKHWNNSDEWKYADGDFAARIHNHGCGNDTIIRQQLFFHQ